MTQNLQYSMIISSINDKTAAQLIAKTLVTQKACACVNIIPNVQSIYSWNDEVVFEDEFLILIKTIKSKVSKVRELILNNHPYQIPEIIELDICSGYDKYLDWIYVNSK